MPGTGAALQRLLARREKGHSAAQGVCRCFRHDEMCDMHGVERSPEQCHTGHAAQGVAGVDGVALESAVAGQVRASPVAWG